MRPEQLIGHRGFPSAYPENTLLGFEKALAAGALNLEADLQLSREGIPVIFHDRSLKRLCGESGRVHQRYLQELRGFSPHDPSSFGERFFGEPFLTLEALVALIAAHPQATLYLEIKRLALRAFGARKVLDAIAACLPPVAERTVLISFSLFVLELAKQRGYRRIGPVLNHWSQLESGRVRRLAPEVVFFDQHKLPTALHYDSDPPLAVYETSDPSRARQLLAQGVSLVETDAIATLIESADAGS